MLRHQAMRPNERGWRGEEGESEREDLLCIGTLQVHTREKGGCVEKRGDIEKASGCIGFKGERNSSSEAGFDKVKIPDEGRGGRKAQEGRCPSRHNVTCGCRF